MSSRITYPWHWPNDATRAAGHEGVGIVTAVGEGVTSLRPGQRVAVPWLGYACGTCQFCLTGWETLCLSQQNTGYSVDGCYAEYFLAEAAFATPVPAGIDPREAAPLTCAGVTTYKAIKVGNVRPGNLVVVSGIGGLGHMAVQYAKIFGRHGRRGRHHRREAQAGPRARRGHREPAVPTGVKLLPCPLTFAPFLMRGLAGASTVWLADLELARLGRGDRAGVRSPQVAGDGPHEHHGKQDNRYADQHAVMPGPGDHQGEQQPGGHGVPGRPEARSRQMIHPAVTSAAASMP